MAVEHKTSDNQSIQAHRDECVLAAARAITKAAMDLIYVDPHSWSTRPCSTRKAITALLGQRFGCDRFREGRT